MIPQTGDVPSQQPQTGGDFFDYARGAPPALEPIVQAAASKYGVPLAVAHWVGTHESNWDASAIGPETSTGRAKGAWQFMDGTAKEMGLADPHNFAASTDAAMRYLRRLADKNGGDWMKAVEAYGTFSSGDHRRDAKLKAGFQGFLGNSTGSTGTIRASGSDRYAGWDTADEPSDETSKDPEYVPFRDPPDVHRGTILPFASDDKGKLITTAGGWPQLYVPDMFRAPVRGVIEGGQEARGVRPVDDPTARGDISAAVGALAARPTGNSFAPTGAARVAAEAAAAKAETDRAALGTANQILGWGRTPEGKAARIVGKRAGQDIASGSYYQPETDYAVPARGAGTLPPLALSTGPADEVVGNLDRMRESGKPANLVHVLGPNVEGLAGKISRQPGAAQGIIRQGLKQIDAGASERAQSDVAKFLTKGSSAYRTVVDLLRKRSVEGQPNYERALQGGSIAPLETQFREEWVAASGAAKQAAQDVEVAKSQLNAALGKQPITRGNDYSDSAANSAVREAKARVRTAEEALSQATQNADEVREMMQRAQQDRINNTPGAVWNLRIQRLLDRPKMKAGLRLGYEIQGDEAAANGTRFNPMEYALTPDGEVIRVPNMRTLNVAKKGLDRMYSDTLDEFGRPNETGVAIDMMRRSLLREMDAINPEYAKARQAWAGDSQNIDAVKWAKGIQKISPEQVAQEFSDMSEGEKEFARLGIADTLLQKIGDTSFGADEAKNLLKNPNMRDRLQPIFRTQDEFVSYVNAVADERRMYDVQTRLIRNSETAARRMEDSNQDLSVAGHLAHGAANLAHGRMLRALGSGFRGAREFLHRPNPAVDEAIARTLMNPEGGPQVVNGRLDFSPPAPPIVTPTRTIRPVGAP